MPRLSRESGAVRRFDPGLVGALLAAILVLLVIPGLARAQPGPSGYEISAAPEWGLFVPERWSPISITVTGPNGVPLAETIRGELVVAYHQDATQMTALRLPFTAQAGQVGTARAVINIPRSVQRITISLLDQSGSTLGRVVYAQFANRSAGEQQLAGLAQAGALLAMTDGSCTLPAEVLLGWRKGRGMYQIDVRAFTSALAPQLFPQAAAAYDALSLLVIDADAPFSDAARQAIGQWVVSGGRLVVVASKPGDAWRSWLPAGAPGELVTVAAPSSGPPPGDLIKEVGVRVESEVSSTELAVMNNQRAMAGLPRLPPPAPAATPGAPTPVWVPPAPAREASQRVLGLTDQGRRQGWSVRWNTDGASATGLLAEGPVGFGFVTILGVQPRACVASGADADAAGVWQSALSVILADEMASAAPSDPYRSASGDGPTSSGALRTQLDALFEVPALDTRVFLAISGAMVLLATMVGVGDYFLLRAKRRRHSWLTAIGWVVLASGLAYAGPTLLRDSDTRFARLTVTDVLVQPRDVSAEPRLAFQTGLTSIWAGRSLHTGFLDPAGLPIVPGTAPGGRWRGVSSVPVNWWGNDAFLLPTVDYLQHADSTLPATNALTIRPWTLRSFLDQSSPALGLDVVAVDGGQPQRFVLRDVPQGARLEKAALQTSDGLRALEATRSTDAPPAIELVATDAAITPGWLFAQDWDALPGARSRTHSMITRVASGQWAMLLLRFDGWPPDVRLGEPATASHTALFRLLVPLPGAHRPAGEPASLPATPPSTPSTSSP